MTFIAQASAGMRANPWYSSLPGDAQNALLAGCRTVPLKSGEYLFRRGDRRNGFYCVSKGRLKASTLRENGREAILAVIEAGNWFGQMSMISGAPHAHDVVALENTTVLAVRPQAFETLMNDAVFARAIAQLQSIHTSWLYRIIDDSAAYSTRARIARRLVLLASGDMSMGAAGREEIALSQEMLAMMLDITRQTLAIELKAMVAKGAISLHYGRIQILSRDILSTLQEDD
ncbi:Crp/Fnr family transcriptional regulator [Paraburkholderia sp. J67]|uniref:Crp/Fnr family transcriptional regulator n=1 Tax=Paraburkholderia sp. J67 TaxID=2805435 RepID=UPI002ABE6E74|nr:Crp/Fnr family transcriptional regulator [Paraburkholderia sp. J67]